MASPPGRKIDDLLAALTEAIDLLRVRGDDHWADWLERDRARVANGDAYGLIHIKQAFGGMGSINDSYPADDPEIGRLLAASYRIESRLLAEVEQQQGPRG